MLIPPCRPSFSDSSFYAWKLLSKYLLRDDKHPSTMALYHRTHHICAPHLPLQAYTTPLLSFNFDFIASLTITGNCYFTTSEIMSLSRLPNLGVLELIAPSTSGNPDQRHAHFPVISNSLFKSWSVEENPFPSLRVLRVWGPGLITQNVLRFLNVFESLALFDILGLAEDWENAPRLASHFGWRNSSPASRYWDPILRYLHLILPPGQASSAISPSSPHFRTRADFVDQTLLTYVGRKDNVVSRLPMRSRMPLPENMEVRRSTQSHQLISTTKSSSVKASPTLSDTPCEGSSDLWNFWMYAFIGHLTWDEDLHHSVRKAGTARRRREMDNSDHGPGSLAQEITTKQAVFEDVVLPALPVAHLQLGHHERTRGRLHPTWVGDESIVRHTFAKVHLADRYLQSLLKRMEMDQSSVLSQRRTAPTEQQTAPSTSQKKRHRDGRGAQKRAPEHHMRIRASKKVKLDDMLDIGG